MQVCVIAFAIKKAAVSFTYDIILAFYNTLFISLVIILATTRNYNANFK